MADLEMTKVAAYLAAGICMSIGTIGPALGMGMIGARACDSLGKRPEAGDSIFKAMMMSLVFVESIAIYCLLVAFMMLMSAGR